MAPFIRAGAIYFVIVFVAGFILGTLRELVLVPIAGRTFGVLIELAIMVTISWIVCGRIVRRLRIASDRNGRIVMGASAFVLLILAEFGFTNLFLGWSAGEFFGGFRSLDGALGLLAQIVFGAIPFLQMRTPLRA
jgi:hypothetical protein